MTLKSQFAVLAGSTRETARTTTFLKDAMEKALARMSAEIEAKAKAMTPVMMAHPVWPFGTVVQHVSLDARAIVLTDDGTNCQVMTMQHHEVIETDRSDWTPVED